MRKQIKFSYKFKRVSKDGLLLTGVSAHVVRLVRERLAVCAHPAVVRAPDLARQASSRVAVSATARRCAAGRGRSISESLTRDRSPKRTEAASSRRSATHEAFHSCEPQGQRSRDRSSVWVSETEKGKIPKDHLPTYTSGRCHHNWTCT